jgi:hypothetical protein
VNGGRERQPDCARGREPLTISNWRHGCKQLAARVLPYLRLLVLVMGWSGAKLHLLLRLLSLALRLQLLMLALLSSFWQRPPGPYSQDFHGLRMMRQCCRPLNRSAVKNGFEITPFLLFRSRMTRDL